MELYKRAGSDAYYVSLTDAAGNRIRKSTGETDKKAAQRAAMKLVAAIEREAAETVGGKTPVTLVEALVAYEAKLRREGKVSVSSAELHTRKTALGIGSRFHLDGTRYLHTLTRADLDALTRARMAEGNGPQSIAHEIKNLRAATAYSDVCGHRTPEIRSWGLPTLTQKTRFLTWAEFEATFAKLDPTAEITQRNRSGSLSTYKVTSGIRVEERQDAQDLLVALTMCGGRWSEVAALTWDRIDMARRCIMLFGSKTQKERLVPLPAQFLAVLERRSASRTPRQSLVFPARSGGRRKGSCRAILRAMDRAGLNDPETVRTKGKATVHSLRHTFASWLIQNGAGLAEVQEALGHTTLQMTRRYAHLSGDKAVLRLGHILDGIGTN